MPTAETSPPPPDRPEKSREVPGWFRRHGAARFVALFVVTVIGLLAGYRYAIDTAANDWYLFQVARHTSWMLEIIGHSADVEKTSGIRLDAATVRQSLSGITPEIDPTPLSPWEIWRYRAQLHRQNTRDVGEIGPQVFFKLSPGSQHELATLEAELGHLKATNGSESQVEAVNDRLRSLRRELASAGSDPAQRRAREGRFFNFIVIPECGAIEVMAIFFASVIAFPAAARSKLRGLAWGLPVMYLVNILRLSFLAYVGAVDSSGQWFEFLHEYVWQAAYVIFVVIVWVAWVEFDVRRRPS